MTVAVDSLPCVYTELDQAYFECELKRVYAETEIERQWLEEYELPVFDSDQDILAEVRRGGLRRVYSGVGYEPRMYLDEWEPSRSDADHEFHYSPPYLRPEAIAMLGLIGHNWARRLPEISMNHAIPVTSLVRSLEYQQRLSKMAGKITIKSDDGLSSHLAAISFDLDARGLYARKGVGSDFAPVNINNNPDSRNTIMTSQAVLREVLEEQQQTGAINYVEELAGTNQHVFHVCTRPHATNPLVVEQVKIFGTTKEIPAIQA